MMIQVLFLTPQVLIFDVLKAGAIAYVNANALVQKENAGEIGKAVSFRDVPTNA